MVGARYLELPLLGVWDVQNTTIEGPVLNSGKVPLYRVEILPRDFHATKSGISLFRFPLYRATYCTGWSLSAFRMPIGAGQDVKTVDLSEDVVQVCGGVSPELSMYVPNAILM